MTNPVTGRPNLTVPSPQGRKGQEIAPRNYLSCTHQQPNLPVAQSSSSYDHPTHGYTSSIRKTLLEMGAMSACPITQVAFSEPDGVSWGNQVRNRVAETPLFTTESTRAGRDARDCAENALRTRNTGSKE